MPDGVGTSPIGTWAGRLYLATVTGIASRRIVGYARADHLCTELGADALANAVLVAMAQIRVGRASPPAANRT